MSVTSSFVNTSFDSGGGLSGSVTIENTGSSHIRLAGVLQFRDEGGKIVQQVNLPGGVVLPGEQNVRDLLVDTPKDLAAGKYTVTAVVDYGGEVLVGARSQYAVP